MRIGKYVIPILLMLLMLTACGSEGDTGDDTSLEWPAQLMGNILPSPAGVITSIDRGDTFFGSDAPAYITVVSFKGIGREDCKKYIDKLETLGFTDDATKQEQETKCLYSGSMNSSGAAVTFQYDFETDTGFVSYNPELNNDSIGD
jgi:hypothetical protein